MAVDRASDNPFPSVLMVEGDPEDLASNPAAGQRRLAVGTDHILYLVDDSGVKHQVGDAAGLAAHLADTSAAHAASAISFTPNGSIAATDVQAAIQEVRDEAGASGGIATDTFWGAAGDLAVATGNDAASRLTIGTAGTGLLSDGTTAAWGSVVPVVPVIDQSVTNPFASATTVAVTVSAPASGKRLIALVGSTGRGCNSISQTNVTWTQRYTNNGNSQYCEVWTGVVTGAAGTTVTANFTGSNACAIQYIELPSTAPAFTSATGHATTTGASGTVYFAATTGGSTTTLGDYYVWVCTAGQASSYSMMNQAFLPFSSGGGYFRCGFLRSFGGPLNLISINVASNAYNMALVKIS